VTNGSWRIGTAWHLLTTKNFTVCLHDLYKWSFAGHALHRYAGAVHIFAVASMIVHDWPVPSTPPVAHDINSHVCDPPPTCRAQECQLACGQCLCGVRWQQLVASAKSLRLSHMPLARMCREHTHACQLRCFRTDHMYCAHAVSSDLGTIVEGLWGPICVWEGGSCCVSAWVYERDDARFATTSMWIWWQR